MKQFTSTQVKNEKAFVNIVKNKILKLHETVHFDAGKKYAKCN